jgi:hypothetical protein
MSRAEHCELKKWFTDLTTGERRRGWKVISIQEALQTPDEIFRCVECHGRVRPHNASKDQSAHFEHEQRHAGCSRSDGYVEGTPHAMHPRAVEF